jgi:hypothetical protein
VKPGMYLRMDVSRGWFVVLINQHGQESIVCGPGYSMEETLRMFALNNPKPIQLRLDEAL